MMSDIFSKTLIQKEFIIVPPRPNRDEFDYEHGGSDWFRAHEAWQKKYRKSELLKWESFENKLPDVQRKIVMKNRWMNKHPVIKTIWWKASTDLYLLKKQGYFLWTYANEYKKAIAEEQLFECLGDDWEECIDGFKKKDKDLSIHWRAKGFSIFYKLIDYKWEEVRLPKRIATIQLVKEILTMIEFEIGSNSLKNPTC